MGANVHSLIRYVHLITDVSLVQILFLIVRMSRGLTVRYFFSQRSRSQKFYKAYIKGSFLNHYIHLIKWPAFKTPIMLSLEKKTNCKFIYFSSLSICCLFLFKCFFCVFFFFYHYSLNILNYFRVL